MAEDTRLSGIVETARVNAILAWILIAFLGVVTIESLLDGDLLWAGFALVVMGLAVIPTIAFRGVTVTLPWEVMLLAALPIIGRSFATVPLTSRFTTYLSVAAIALIIAVELHLFTPVQMTPSFAVFFVVIATMGTAGVWAVVRWVIDISFMTTFLLDPALTESEIENRLMWEFVWSMVAGVVSGVVFEGFFRRRSGFFDRINDELEGDPS